jgi:large subunit ribosomal protein L32
MAHPKSKTSKARRDKRRTHYKVGFPQMAICPSCGATHVYHRVCNQCGTYRGKQAVEKEVSA